VTGYALHDKYSIPDRDWGFHFAAMSILALRLTQPSLQLALWALSIQVERMELEMTSHLTPSSKV